MFTPYEHSTETSTADHLIRDFNSTAREIEDGSILDRSLLLRLPTMVLALAQERHQTADGDEPLILLVDMQQAEDQITPNACLTLPCANVTQAITKTSPQKIAQEYLGKSVFIEQTRLKFKRGMPLGLYKKYSTQRNGSRTEVTSIPTVLSYCRPASSFKFRARYSFRYGVPAWLPVNEAHSRLAEQSVELPENILALEALHLVSELVSMQQYTNK